MNLPAVLVTPTISGVMWLLGGINQLAAQTPEEIIVVGIAPGGASLEQRKVPYPVQHSQIDEQQALRSVSVADLMKLSFSSISLNEAQNNPLQPDLQYRGFTASPLLGLAQGMAVYQNGVRINEPLGDAINWDLLPLSAVSSLTLSGGANPMFGLNSLGGSLALRMKDGFSFEGIGMTFSGGSFGRETGNVEVGGQHGNMAYYFNAEFFSEDGWRDYSASEALNLYSSIGWRFETGQLDLSYQYGDSDLTGNGTAPVELMALNRAAIFTGPDITANKLNMLSVELTRQINSRLSFKATGFSRHNETASFNGDGSEFLVCEFDSGEDLIAGLEDDQLEALGLDDESICSGQFSNAEALQDFLNAANPAGDDLAIAIDSLGEDLSGSGQLSDAAINNISRRKQRSHGADLQWTLLGEFAELPLQLVWGAAYYRGDTHFDAVLELSAIDPITRLTNNLGTGTFVDSQATAINTENESYSLYATSTLDLSESIALTLSARANRTRVILQDRSGLRPELNGTHSYQRLNPAAGITWQWHRDHNFYASVSQSSRAPTPIELACNEGVFELARQYAVDRGDDPDTIDFECRLPNAFLADPPLQDVVTTSFEVGSRGAIGDLSYSAGLFHAGNRDDILFQTTGRQTGLFANVDRTRRRGIESSLNGQWRAMDWRASYSYIEASFEDDFAVLSPNHPAANEQGEIAVRRGDRIPGIPQHQLKLSSYYRFSDSMTLGLDLVANSEQTLRGDESAQLDAVPGYRVLNLSAHYAVNSALALFARIDNLLDTDYETFGLLGEQPGELAVPLIETFSIPTFLGAAAPRAGFVGFHLFF